MWLAKYGVAFTFEFPQIKRGAVDYAVAADWTPQSGDVQIIKDNGSAAATTNLPTAVTSGNGAVWRLTLTATEMQAAKITISIIDAATKAVEDNSLPIFTYGNASAHLVDDFSVVKPTAAGIATAILTDLLSGTDFNTAGSFGKLIKDNLDVAVSTRSTYAGGAPPTAAAIATAILTDLLSSTDFNTAGSFGKLIKDNLDVAVSTRNPYVPPSAATIVTAIMTDLLSGSDFNLAGSFGKLIKDNLDAKVSTISGGGGGAGVTLTELQTELAAIKGTGFSPETDTMEKIADAVATLTPTEGTGAYTLTITVHDQDGQPLEGATVRVSEGVTSLLRTTGPDGSFSHPFAVDAKTYDVVITKPGYDFEPTTLSITANRTITYTLTQVAITPDPDPAKTRVVMTTYDEIGAIKPNVSVTFGLIRAPIGDVNHVFSNTRITLQSDASGLIDVSLWSGALYEAQREESAFKLRFTPTGEVYAVPSFIGPSVE